MTTTWSKPDILKPERFDDAWGHLATYFHEEDYSGSYFERLGRGRDWPEVANRITSDDIVSLSMLAVPVRQGWVARKLLEGPLADEIADLLTQIPVEWSITEAVGREALEDAQAAAKLWTKVRSLKHFGPVRTSKLLARKRPHLIPIYDSVVAAEFGARGSATQWTDLAAMFEQPDFADHLRLLRKESEIGDDISLLRVLDVAVWMEGKRKQRDPAGS